VRVTVYEGPLAKKSTANERKEHKVEKVGYNVVADIHKYCSSFV